MKEGLQRRLFNALLGLLNLVQPGTMYNTVFAYAKDDDVVFVPSARGLQSALASVKQQGLTHGIFSVTCVPLPSVGPTVES